MPFRFLLVGCKYSIIEFRSNIFDLAQNIEYIRSTLVGRGPGRNLVTKDSLSGLMLTLYIFIFAIFNAWSGDYGYLI